MAKRFLQTSNYIICFLGDLLQNIGTTIGEEPETSPTIESEDLDWAKLQTRSLPVNAMVTDDVIIEVMPLGNGSYKKTFVLQNRDATRTQGCVKLPMKTMYTQNHKQYCENHMIT